VFQGKSHSPNTGFLDNISAMAVSGHEAPPREYSAGRMLVADIRRPGEGKLSDRPYSQAELAADVRRNGVQQPLAVEHLPQHGGPTSFNGLHRLDAAQRAGVPDVPVVVKHLPGEPPPMTERRPSDEAEFNAAYDLEREGRWAGEHTAALLGHFEAADDTSYRMQHQGPDADDGEAVHEVGSGKVYPADIHQHPEWYISSEETGAWDSWDKVRKSKDWPSRRVTIYRSLPSPHREVNTGDWVTSSAAYARDHGRQSNPDDDWPVVKFEARADQLRTADDSINEWSYHGPKVNRALVHFSGGKNHRGKGPRGGKADAALHEHEPPEMYEEYTRQNTEHKARKRAEREAREAEFTAWSLGQQKEAAAHEVVAHFEETAAAQDPDERPFGYYTLRHRTEDLGERKPRHFIEAHTPEGSVVGRMNWFGTTGWVHHIDVAGEEDDADNGSSSIGDGRDHQGRGLATAMWDWSQEMRPKAKHSKDQTNQGKAWARGLKDRERRDPPDGPPSFQVTAAAEYGPKPEFRAAPEHLSDDEKMAHWEQQRKIKYAWEAHVTHGISTGQLTPERAKELGHYFDGHQTDERGNPKWQPLPQHLYHVTTDLPGVRAHGLKTRSELAQERGGHGLGGGPDDMISLTDDHDVARNILRAVHEFHHVVNGRYTPAQMWEDAKAGKGAPRPFHEDLAGYHEPGWKDGDPLPRRIDSEVRGKEIRAGGLVHSPQEMAEHEGPGWAPHHESSELVGRDGVKRYNVWERDLTPDEHRAHAADFYKNFAAYRAWAGGHEDPLFFSTDTKGFAAKDPAHFAIVHARPRPGAMGHPVSALGEWRTGTGDALETHRAEQLEGGHLKEASVSLASRFQPGLRNPHTGGDEWFHGTHARPEDLQEGFHVPTSHDHYDEEMRGHMSYWNTFLGTHFAAAHSMADHFGRSGASNGDDEDEQAHEPYSRYEEKAPSIVAHARLHLANPKVYASEHDMDNDAYEHETKAGNWISKHFTDGYEDEDPSGPDYDPETPGEGEEWPIAAKFRHDSRQPLIGPDDRPVGYGGLFSNDHPGQRRRAEWLSSHPDKAGIAARYRQRLIDQGHDGILYGNELETDHAGGGEHGALSAIAFHPHQVEITQHHDVDRPCLSREEGEHQRSRMPQPGQEKLPGVEEHADKFPNGFLRGAALVAHFEEPKTAAGPYMQQKLFHVQPDPTRHAPESGRHNPADPEAHARWREENEEGYRRPLEDQERGNWDEDAGAWHHPDKGWHCHVCGEFHDSPDEVEEHETGHTNWDTVHPGLPGEMHRGIRLDDDGTHGWLPHHHRGKAANEDTAQAILGHLGELGTHWTPDEDQARHYAGIGGGYRKAEGDDMHVVVHARKPALEDIETDPWTLADQKVIGFDQHDDAEIPLREGAPVHVTGVSWKFHDEPASAWRRHDLGERSEHTAAIEPGRKNMADIGSSMLAYDKDLSPDDRAFISAAIDHIRRGAPASEPIDAGDAETIARSMRANDRLRDAGWEVHDTMRYPRGVNMGLGEHHRVTLSPNHPSGWHVRTHPADYGSAAGHLHHDLDVRDEDLPSALTKYYASPQIRGELAAQRGEVISEGRHEAAVVAHFEEGPLPEYHGEPLYHGTRSVLEPGEHLTVEDAAAHPNNADIQTDPYVHATTDPREAHRWGERANAYQAQHRHEGTGRERRIGPGENAGHAYRPRVYEVEPTGHVEPDLEYADTEHDSWRSAAPMRVKREVGSLSCYDCPDTGSTEEHWPDHPHYEYLRQQADEDEADCEERGRTAALTGGPAQLSAREERGDRWHEYKSQGEDHLHRGIHVRLPDHLDGYVHDESVPREDRARALQQHFADSGEGLGMHWTPHPQIAQRAIGNAADAGHGLPDGRLYRGEPEDKTTDVMFHVRRPGERSRLPAREHEEHDIGWKYSQDEDEFPLKPGSPLRLAGISWKRHEPQYPNEPFEHVDFAKPARHVSSAVPALPEVVAHFEDTAALDPDFPFEDPEHEHRTPFHEAWDAAERDALYPKEQREAPSISIGRRPVEDLPPGGEGFQWRENSPHRDYFRSGGPEGWRRVQLNRHLREDHHSPGLEDAMLRADAQGRGSADHYQALDAVHRRAHGRELGEWGSQNQDSPEAWELENGHRRFAEEDEVGEREARAEKDEHFDKSHVTLHGQRSTLRELHDHLRDVHGTPGHAMPEYHHHADDSQYTTPYESELEELHDQDHGEMGTYRHDDPDEAGAHVHGEEMSPEDAYSHLSEHHGHNYEELRSEEPSASRLEQYHEEAHDRERGTRWNTHHRNDPWDFSEGKARRVHPLEKDPDDEDVADSEEHGRTAVVAHFEEDDEDPDDYSANDEWDEDAPPEREEHEPEEEPAAHRNYRLPYMTQPPEGELREHLHHHHGLDSHTSDLYMSPDNQRRWHDSEHRYKTNSTHQHDHPQGTPGEEHWPDVFELSEHTDFPGGTRGDWSRVPGHTAPFKPLRSSESVSLPEVTAAVVAHFDDDGEEDAWDEPEPDLEPAGHERDEHDFVHPMVRDRDSGERYPSPFEEPRCLNCERAAGHEVRHRPEDGHPVTGVQEAIDRRESHERDLDEGRYDRTRYCDAGCQRSHEEDRERSISVHHTFGGGEDESRDIRPREEMPQLNGPFDEPVGRPGGRYEVRNPSAEHRCHYCRNILPQYRKEAAVTAAYDYDTDEGPYTWEEIARRHPRVYGDDEDHAPGMGEGGGEAIADAAAELYHDRPGHPYSESEGELHPSSGYPGADIEFHPRTVDVNRIDYMRVDRSEHDHRVERARKGFQDYRQREKIPPLILVHRHGVYYPADGHHRANGAEQAHWPSVRAYVAYSPHEDEPFAGKYGDPPQKGPFHGAETRDRPPMLDHNGEPARPISFPGFPHTTERPRPQAHEASRREDEIVLAPVCDTVPVIDASPLAQAITAAGLLGSWAPQTREDALDGISAFTAELLPALRQGLLRLAAVIEEMPVHPDVAELLYGIAQSVRTASQDTGRLIERLPTEASWQEPGPPNR